MSVLRALRANVGALGWANGLLYCTDRALHVASAGRCRLYKYHFVAQPVPAQPLPGLPRASRTSVALSADAEDLIRRFPRPPAVIRRRLADGAVCFLATSGEDSVGFLWVKPDGYDEDEVRCRYRLEPVGTAAWDFDAYVAPPFRMSRAFVQLWDAAYAHLRGRGCRWSMSRISAFNPGSLSSHRRLGATALSSAVFVVLGPLQVMLASCRPFVHFGFGRGPTLVFRPPPATATTDPRSPLPSI